MGGRQTVGVTRGTPAMRFCFQPVLKLGDSVGRPRLAARELDVRKSLRNQPGAMPEVVESEHGVIKANCHGRDCELVCLGLWQSFNAAPQVVGKESGRTALEGRQVGASG